VLVGVRKIPSLCCSHHLRGELALDLGFIAVVPRKQTRVTAWEFNRAVYKRRNEIERLFRRLKGFRRIFSRFERLDLIFVAFINFALIVDGLRRV
jgi:transposase